MQLHILGIRHHGVGSARAVQSELARIRPDLILVEGPPEMDAIAKFVSDDLLTPPVAVLGYNADDLKQASFYPFAEFSPEWQAMRYGVTHRIPVRMTDMPLRHKFAFDQAAAENTPQTETAAGLSHLATIGGFPDTESWWEYWFEQKNVSAAAAEYAQEHFEAILAAMRSLRPGIDTRSPEQGDREERIREAFMREAIRKAQRELFEVVVFVCGAWHGPALEHYATTDKTDAAMLKGLPAIKKAEVTWVPWTHQRLQMQSGYGAGIASAGWYDHRWQYPEDQGMRWLTHCAHLFRSKKMDVSTAHIIDAYRLADALAALRGQARIGLDELNEATRTVLCFGDPLPMRLIEKELIVGNKIGKIAAAVPKLPLQADFEQQLKATKLKLNETPEELELDLRKTLHLSKSVLLHRLLLLRIKWGKEEYIGGKGTFKEKWILDWRPEMMLDLIEAGVWGNTIENACKHYVQQRTAESTVMTELGQLVREIMLAELYDAFDPLLRRLDELATLASDVKELMGAVLPLIDVSRYGNVRKTDQSALAELIESLIIRICVGLPNACFALDDEASIAITNHIKQLHDAIALLENADLTTLWHTTLNRLAGEDAAVNARVQGRACRLLFDRQVLPAAEVGRRFGLALATAQAPEWAAAWVEGFLKDSGMVLLHDAVLWDIFNRWLAELPDTAFTELLPLLRRTFAQFEPALRRQLGEKAARGLRSGMTSGISSTEQETVTPIDLERARKVLPVLKTLLLKQ